ncbi:hypothetical protein [Prescottella equi]|uniref:hypothetical protein n=1 Tax=Rhodococcus hoagii TaxID=43767 RepID=UPI0007CD97C3|nr:hypothetical protein [Prescottella equi]
MDKSTTSTGRHRKTRQRAAIAVAVPVAASLAFAGIADAAPSQPGVSVEGDQPGVSTGGGEQPGTTAPAPAPAPEREYVPYYTPIYQDAPSKPVYNYDYSQNSNYSGGGRGYYSGYSDNYNGGGYSQPVYTAPVDDPDVVAVVEAPVKTFRAGDFIANQTDLLPEKQWNQLNATFADMEAAYGQFWRSTGVDASRADRIAAASIGTGVIGAATGAAIGAVPGALIGGTIGGNIGLTMGGIVSIPLAPVPGLPAVVVVPTTVAGTAVGAAAGAAIGGAIGAIPGAAVGVALGTATGAGEPTTEPVEFTLPSKPRADQEAITAQTQQVVEQVESMPGGAGVVEAARTVVEQAPQVAAQTDKAVREAISAQPGGAEAIAGFDAFVSEVAPWTAIVGDSIAEAGAAVGTGISA